MTFNNEEVPDDLPVELIRYIREYLCVCSLCYHAECRIDVNTCLECERYWCHDCKPIPRILKNIYDRSSGTKKYICAWCIRETKSLLRR